MNRRCIYRKRGLAALLAAALLFGLTACAGPAPAAPPPVEVITADDVSTAEELIAAEKERAQREAEAAKAVADAAKQNVAMGEDAIRKAEEQAARPDPDEALAEAPAETPSSYEPSPAAEPSYEPAPEAPADEAPADETPQPAPAAPQKITVDSALAIALRHAGLSSDQVMVTKAELDTDDSLAAYEIEFLCRGTEYEYEIDAYSGAILDWDAEEED